MEKTTAQNIHKMSIKIKQKEDVYELELEQEKWQFRNRNEMYDALEELLSLKNKYGRINKDDII